VKPSKFNIFIPIEDEQKIIYNTFSDSIVIGDIDLIEAINHYNKPILLSDKQIDYLNELKKLGIMVDDNTNEEKELEYWFQKQKYDSTTFNATILLTLACNMKCTYCFEQGIDSALSMNKKMYQEVCHWLIDKLEKVRPKEFVLTFFGGEPLLNIEALEYLSKNIYLATKKMNIELKIGLITNGLLLTKKLVNSLKQFGLDWIKVTLDGDEVTHDSLRPLKNGKGTFRSIVNNLLIIKGIVPIVVGGNYDNNTKKNIPILLDELKRLGFTDEIKEMAFKPILGFPNHENCSSHQIEACTFSETNVEDIFYLNTEIEKRGFNALKKIALGPCEAMRENSYAIDPSGLIYKCAAMAGRKEYSIGNIKNDDSNNFYTSNNIAFMTSDPWKKCKNCKYIPICGGGCRMGALLQSGDVSETSCEKEYFEKVTTKLIMSEI